jgi:hypothetical protein
MTVPDLRRHGGGCAIRRRQRACAGKRRTARRKVVYFLVGAGIGIPSFFINLSCSSIALASESSI